MNFWPFSREPGAMEKMVADLTAKATAVFDHTTLFLNGHEVGYGDTGVDGAYSNSWIAYACIRRLAQDAAGVPLLFLSDPKDPESSVPENHPTRRMFEHPGQYFSTSELVQWIVTMLNMRGDFFIPFDDPMRPTQMLPQTDPKHWRAVIEGGTLLGWEYRNGTVFQTWLPDDIIHHRFINPDKPYRGQTPLQAAASAFKIEMGASQLTEDIIAKGGEKAMVFEAGNLTKSQREQAVAMLRGRRTGNSKVSRDVLLPNHTKPLDPKFIDDDMKVLDAGAAQPDKICAVYGVAKSLLGFEDVDKFATFEGRKRMYYTDTLVPMLSGVEDAWDRMFVETLVSRYRCFVRFDWSAVAALQDDLAKRFEMAGKAKKDGLPWSVLNERFELGLDTKKIPGADVVLVPATLAPIDKLIEEWNSPTPPPSTPQAGGVAEAGGKAESDSGAPRLTNALIQKRAANVRSNVQRGMRLLKLQQEMRKEWKATLQPVMNKAIKATANVTEASKVKVALRPVFDGLGEKLGTLAAKYHEAAALEGEAAIVELVEGKMSDAEASMYRKQHQWSPGVTAFLKKRKNRIVGMEPPLFDDVTAAVIAAVTEGMESSEVQHVIRARFGSAPGGINRAVTIARTEVGTAYNTARYSEISNQGFEKHVWQNNGADTVREPPESDFDHATAHDEPAKVGEKFSTGLLYPQEDGGDPANVINCNCHTIPLLEGAR